MIRINKYLSQIGVDSRRHIDQLITQNEVTVNGQTATLGQQIDPNIDIIKINHKTVSKMPPKLVYIALNKPVKIVSSVTDPHGRKTVLDLVRTNYRLYPIGRLDYDTSGLILLTNDGDLTQKITHPKYHFGKTYLAETDSVIDLSLQDRLRQGVFIDGFKTSPAQVSSISPTKLKITIFEGKNRQIRKMFDALGINLVSLHRLQIGPIGLKGLKPGFWRYLDPSEIRQLKSIQSTHMP